MRFDTLPIEPRVKAFERQSEAYQAAQVPAEMTIKLPFAVNVSHFFVTEALLAAGIDPMGLARQLDQVLLENIGNNLAAKIKRAVEKTEALPGQADVDKLVADYDFSGIRAPSSEEGMTVTERTIRSEIRKLWRQYINGGLLADQKDEEGNIVFSVVRVQTKPEADKNTLQKYNLPIDVMEALVSAAYERQDFSIEDSNGRVATLPLSEEPEFDDGDNPINHAAITEQARRLAEVLLAKRSTVAAAPKGMKLITRK